MSNSNNGSNSRRDSVLYQLLRATRTLDDDPNHPEDMAKARDFWGSPLWSIQLVEPYPKLTRLDDPEYSPPTSSYLGSSISDEDEKAAAEPAGPAGIRRKRLIAEKSKVAAHESAAASDFLLIDDWSDQSIPDTVPRRLVTFLEILRLWASPQTNQDPAGSESDWRCALLERGWLAPKKLYRGYLRSDFLADRFDSTAGRRDTGGPLSHYVRRAILHAYLHVLMRTLATVNPVLSNAIRGDDKNDRERQLREVLTPCCLPWIVESACKFVRSANFARAYCTGDGATPLAAMDIPFNIQGGGRRQQVTQPSDRARPVPIVPESIFMLMQINAARFGRGVMYSCPRDYRDRCEDVLAGPGRMDHAKSMLETPNWIGLEPHLVGSAHDGKVTNRELEWMAFCIGIELMLQKEPNRGSDAADPMREPSTTNPDQGTTMSIGDGDPQDDVSTPSRANAIAIERIVEDAANDPVQAILMGGFGRQPDDARQTRSRFLPPSAGAPDPVSTSAAITAEDETDEDDALLAIRFSNLHPANVPLDSLMPFSCQVQTHPLGAAPLGAIWLPIPNSFLALPFFFQVVRVTRTDDGQAPTASFERVDFSFVDSYEMTAGPLYWIEPDDENDPRLPPGFHDGDYRAFAHIVKKKVLGTDSRGGYLCIISIIGTTGPLDNR